MDTPRPFQAPRGSLDALRGSGGAAERAGSWARAVSMTERSDETGPRDQGFVRRGGRGPAAARHAGAPQRQGDAPRGKDGAPSEYRAARYTNPFKDAAGGLRALVAKLNDFETYLGVYRKAPPPPYCSPYRVSYGSLNPPLLQAEAGGDGDALLETLMRRGKGEREARLPPPLPRTNRTSLVSPLVLIGHAASLPGALVGLCDLPL